MSSGKVSRTATATGQSDNRRVGGDRLPRVGKVGAPFPLGTEIVACLSRKPRMLRREGTFTGGCVWQGSARRRTFALRCLKLQVHAAAEGSRNVDERVQRTARAEQALIGAERRATISP